MSKFVKTFDLELKGEPDEQLTFVRSKCPNGCCFAINILHTRNEKVLLGTNCASFDDLEGQDTFMDALTEATAGGWLDIAYQGADDEFVHMPTAGSA